MKTTAVVANLADARPGDGAERGMRDAGNTDAGDTIDARPYPLRRRDPLALIVIDMQRDFLDPGGFGAALGNDVAPLRRIVPVVRRLLDAFRARGLPIVHTREGHAPDLSDCPPAKRARGRGGLRIGDPGPMGRILVLGEPGNDFVPELAPAPGELVVAKPGKGAFFATDLDRQLRELGISQLLLAGVTTEVCVQTTMREANDRGYECALIEDATESYFPAFKAATLEMITAQDGIVGWVASSDAVLRAIEVGARSTEHGARVTEADVPHRPSAPFHLDLGAIAADPRRIAWRPFRPGVEIHVLYQTDGDGPAAVLLRYAPGAGVPRHLHQGHEHILVLAGSQEDERGRYRAGELVVNPPASAHTVTSAEGCVVLAVWERPVRFVEG
jgi:nicotinamidase-related amidase/quercetin dioxygenase-like cupin family protein